MPNDVAAPLLAAHASEDSLWPPNARSFFDRRKAAATFGLLGFSLLVAYLGITSSAGKPSPLEFVADGWGGADCYKFTGGTCFVMGCNEDRHADCSWGKCWCSKGCTGPDGKCHNQRDELLMSNFTLRVMAFPDYYLYTPRFWAFRQLRVTNTHVSEYSTQFNLWRIPGKTDDGNMTTTYFLQPSEFPDYAVAVKETQWEVGLPTKGGSIDFPAGSLYNGIVAKLDSTSHLPWNPWQVMLRVCRPIGHPEALRIDGKFGAASLYVHHASWLVYAWIWSDPGPEGYWIPDKPLDASIETCPQR